MEACLQLLQQHLSLPRPRAARLLLGQPALALQPQDTLLAAIRFLHRNLVTDVAAASLPGDTSTSVTQRHPSATAVATTTTAAATAAVGSGRIPVGLCTEGLEGDGLGAGSRDGALEAGSGLTRRSGKPSPQQLQQRRQQQQQQQQQVSSARKQQQRQGLEAVVPLAERYPHVLMLKPQRAAAALSALEQTLWDVLGPSTFTGRAGGGAAGRDDTPASASAAAAAAAVRMATGAPQLLLCQVIRPGASVGPNSKDRNSSVMAKLEVSSPAHARFPSPCGIHLEGY